MTLLDLLKLIAKDYFPPKADSRGEFDTRPQSIFKVTLCFMCEKETWLTCNIQNEILVPWYDCEITSIQPDNDNEDSICVWLKDAEYLTKYLREDNEPAKFDGNIFDEYSKICRDVTPEEQEGDEALQINSDAISRQAVLSYIYNDLGLGDEENGNDVERQMELESSYKYVKSLPPVKP